MSLLPIWAFVDGSRANFTFYNVFYTRYLLYGEFMVDIVALEPVFLRVILFPPCLFLSAIAQFLSLICPLLCINFKLRAA